MIFAYNFGESVAVNWIDNLDCGLHVYARGYKFFRNAQSLKDCCDRTISEVIRTRRILLYSDYRFWVGSFRWRNDWIENR